MLGQTIQYTRPYLYPKQERAIFSGKRWSLSEASTKSGKTVGAIARIIEAGLGGKPGQNFWWVAPVSDQARIAFARVKQNLTPGVFRAYEHPTVRIELITGATIGFRSADNPDSLFGEDVFGAVVDEASRQKAEAWHAVRSTLTATRGWGVLIGNVKGRQNWFYEWCRRVEAGKDPNAHYERISWKDAVEAGVLDLEEIEDAKRNLPEQVFRELYEAEASDDGANPFGLQHIAVCIVEQMPSTKPVAFGIDLAKTQDYFVVIGLDEGGNVCVFDRWQGIAWDESIRRVHRLIGEDCSALVDSTGLGDPVLAQLQVEHGNVQGFNFSNASKQRLMEGLSVSIQSHEITFPQGPISRELQSFEYETKGGRTFYSAPQGYHDDCVCALALARQAWAATAPGANMMEFYSQTTARQKAIEATLPQENNRPWRPQEEQVPSFEDLLDNELTKLYEETIKAQLPGPTRLCGICHELVDGRSRVTDGEFVWHQECLAGFTRAA